MRRTLEKERRQAETNGDDGYRAAVCHVGGRLRRVPARAEPLALVDTASGPHAKFPGARQRARNAQRQQGEGNSGDGNKEPCH